MDCTKSDLLGGNLAMCTADRLLSNDLDFSLAQIGCDRHKCVQNKLFFLTTIFFDSYILTNCSVIKTAALYAAHLSERERPDVALDSNDQSLDLSFSVLLASTNNDGSDVLSKISSSAGPVRSRCLSVGSQTESLHLSMRTDKGCFALNSSGWLDPSLINSEISKAPKLKVQKRGWSIPDVYL